jgi:hypothetical protein
MTRIVVDELLRSKLHNLSEPLELCDESGRVLARLTPKLDLSKRLFQKPSCSAFGLVGEVVSWCVRGETADH